MYTSKSNYSARWSGTEFFRRRGDGTLEPANLRSDRRKRQVELLVEVMAKKETEGGEEVTRRDLRRSGNSGRGQSQNPTAKAIIDALKEEFPSFSARNEIDIIVAKAIEEGVITEDLGKRKTLQVAFGSRR